LPETEIHDDSNYAISITSQTANYDEGTYTVEFAVNNSQREAYVSSYVDERRTSLYIDHHLTVENDSDSVRYTVDELYESVNNTTISSSVKANSSLEYVNTFNNLLYVSHTDPSTVYVETGQDKTNARVIQATDSRFPRDWIAATISAGEQFINGTSVDQQGRSLTFIIGESNRSYLNGAAFQRSSQNNVLYVDIDSAYHGNSTVPHEWAHSLQNHKTASDTYWWIEGSAEYITYLLMDSMGEGGYAETNEVIGASIAGQGHLSNQSTWGDSQIEYQYGSDIVYLMDLAIRDNTDREATIIDYLDDLNQHDGLITQKVMVETLRDYGADGIASELPEYVNKSSAEIHVGEEVHEHDILVDTVGNQFTYSVSLPPTPDINPEYSHHESSETWLSPQTTQPGIYAPCPLN